jgi:hypothetical protein
MAALPDWLDDADKLDDDRFIELVGEHVDHVGHVDDEFWHRVGPRVEAIVARKRLAAAREGEPAPELLLARMEDGSAFLIEAPSQTRGQVIAELLRGVDGDVARIPDEDLAARGLTREEVTDARLDLVDLQQWLRDERERQLGE